jgi:hypothetical protein
MKRVQFQSVRVAAAVALAAASVPAVLFIVSVDSPARAPLVVIFLLVAPAAAIAGLLGSLDRLARLVIAGTAAIVIDALVAEIMLALGLWSLRTGVIAVGVITAVCALAQVPPVRAFLAWALAPVRRAISRRTARAPITAGSASATALPLAATTPPTGSDMAGRAAGSGEPEGDEREHGELGEAEQGEPEAVEPDTVVLEAVVLEAVEPEAVEPEAVGPEAVEPDAVEPEAVEPEAVEPDAVEPEGGELENGKPGEPELADAQLGDPSERDDAAAGEFGPGASEAGATGTEEPAKPEADVSQTDRSSSANGTR